MEGKITKLENLKRKIVKENEKEVWFYSEEYKEYGMSASRCGIKGWFGTQDIFFIGSNPSKNLNEDSRYLNFFFRELKENKFEDAHLTDLVKIRAKGTEANKVIEENLKEQKKYLDEEIEILKPKVIVVMGRRCEKFMNKLGYKNFDFIIHYSAIRFPYNIERFRREIRDVKKEYCGK